MSSKDHNRLPAQISSLDSETIAKELARHNPDLLPADLHEIATGMIEELHAAIRRGDRIGIIRENRDGTVDISYLFVEPGPFQKVISRFRSRKRA